jgi:hypothetical protein
MNLAMARVLLDVLEEHQKQTQKGRGEAFDDARTVEDWINCAGAVLIKAAKNGQMRRGYVKLAVIGFRAAMACDRRTARGQAAEARREAPTGNEAAAMASALDEQSRERWGYADEERPSEGWTGAYKSRRAAVDAGRKVYPGEVFYVKGGTCPEPSAFLPDVDDLLDRMAEQAAGEGMPEWVDWPDVSAEGKAALVAALERWAAEHLSLDWWIATGEPERIEPEESGS